MKKLMLNADDLKVSSFHTASAEGGAGTVHGAEITTRPCGPETEYYTCGFVCLVTRDPQYTGPCICS